MKFELFPNPSKVTPEKPKKSRFEGRKSRSARAFAVGLAVSPFMDTAAYTESENEVRLPEAQNVQIYRYQKYLDSDGSGVTQFSKMGDLLHYFSSRNDTALTLPVYIEGDGERAKDYQRDMQPFAKGLHSGIAQAVVEFSPNIEEGEINNPVKGVVFFLEGDNAYNMEYGDFKGYIGFDRGRLNSFKLLSEGNGEYSLDQQAACVGFHETAHRIDFEYDIRDEFLLEKENTNFYDVYKKLSEDSHFMQLFKESFFRQDFCHKDSGHPQDNPAELFATYMTNMQDPNVANRVFVIDSEYPGFKNQFLELSRVMIEMLKSNSNNFQEASITKKIAGVIQVLEK